MSREATASSSDRWSAGFSRGLIDALLEEGRLDRRQADSLLEVAEKEGVDVADVLVRSGVAARDELLATVSKLLDLPTVSLDEISGDATVLPLLPRDRAFRLRAIPLFAVENQLTVAVCDPLDLATLDELRFITSMKILPVFALESDIAKHLRLYYGEADSASVELDITPELEAEDGLSIEGGEEDRPVVRLVNLILTTALLEGASDIHLEPQRSHMAVRFRVDGILELKPFQVPRRAVNAVVSRVKILAQLDISERRIPQDGKIGLTFRQRRVDVRVSTFPTIHGEKVVLRLLDKERMDFRLETLGMCSETLAAWKRLLSLSEGIILVTGPTGCGKSSTLYASLRHLNRPEVNIVTLEDPVEYELPGISQGQIRPQAGFDFPGGLRSILRQDPDIILLGEIRDQATAQIAAQAALTGHLVLATLHTNDAPSAVARLADLGLEPYLVAAVLRGVLAQRLLRRLCPECDGPAEPPDEEAGVLAPWIAQGVPYVVGTGCDRCRCAGYRGRVGIHELLVVDRRLQTAIAAGATLDRLYDLAPGSGYRPMWLDGIFKVREGITSLSELTRVVEPLPSLEAAGPSEVTSPDAAPRSAAERRRTARL